MSEGPLHSKIDIIFTRSPSGLVVQIRQRSKTKLSGPAGEPKTYLTGEPRTYLNGSGFGFRVRGFGFGVWG